jgi:hypothetical protein
VISRSNGIQKLFTWACRKVNNILSSSQWLLILSLSFESYYYYLHISHNSSRRLILLLSIRAHNFSTWYCFCPGQLFGKMCNVLHSKQGQIKRRSVFSFLAISSHIFHKCCLFTIAHHPALSDTFPFYPNTHYINALFNFPELIILSMLVPVRPKSKSFQLKSICLPIWVTCFELSSIGIAWNIILLRSLYHPPHIFNFNSIICLSLRNQWWGNIKFVVSSDIIVIQLIVCFTVWKCEKTTKWSLFQYELLTANRFRWKCEAFGKKSTTKL